MATVTFTKTSRTTRAANGDAQDQSELGRLLHKQRGTRNTRALSKILADGRPVEDKIRRIKTLDTAEHTSEAGGEPDAGDPRPLRMSLSILKTVIKRPQTAASYFQYFLRYHKALKSFGESTATLRARSLPPQILPDPVVGEAFKKNLQPDAADLLKVCTQVLRFGWRYLSKEQYNLVALVRRLCYEILAVNFRVLNYRDRSVIVHLRTLETLFFALHYRPHYPVEAAELIGDLVSKNKRSVIEPSAARNLVLRVLTSGTSIPSLKDALHGLNMCVLRRPVSFESLIDRDLGEILNKEDFACDEDTRREIDGRVQDLLSQIELLRRQKREIDQLEQNLAAGGGESGFDAIRQFYDQSTPAESGRNWESDSANVMVVFPALLGAIEDSLGPLLNGQIVLSELGPVTLFPRRLFQEAFDTLRNAQQRLKTIGHKQFTRARFMRVRVRHKEAIAAEVEVVRVVDDALGQLMRIGQELRAVLVSPGRRTDKRVRAIPLGAIIVPGQDFYLPSDDRTICSSDAFGGMSVAQALEFAAAVAYQAAVFFREPSTTSLASRGGRLREDTLRRAEELIRIGDRQVTRRLLVELQSQFGPLATQVPVEDN
jgi:hypothetical protein